jgi:hypothetical protein
VGAVVRLSPQKVLLSALSCLAGSGVLCRMLLLLCFVPGVSCGKRERGVQAPAMLDLSVNFMLRRALTEMRPRILV